MHNDISPIDQNISIYARIKYARITVQQNLKCLTNTRSMHGILVAYASSWSTVHVEMKCIETSPLHKEWVLAKQ